MALEDDLARTSFFDENGVTWWADDVGKELGGAVTAAVSHQLIYVNYLSAPAVTGPPAPVIGETAHAINLLVTGSVASTYTLLLPHENY